jgi:hypothetical protein
VLTANFIITAAASKRTCCPFHVGFLLPVFYDPEDGGDMFFRKVS